MKRKFDSISIPFKRSTAWSDWLQRRFLAPSKSRFFIILFFACLVCSICFLFDSLEIFDDIFDVEDSGDMGIEVLSASPLRVLSSAPATDTSASTNSTAHATSHSVSSLFGILSSLDPIICTVSFYLIVVAVLIVEYLFHNMHHLTFDTAFEHLLPAVEKELMIAGCTAFIFKIIVNATQNLNPEWFHSLEYADLIVPVFSFIYCFQGLILISLSIQQCHVWSKTYHYKLVELLDKYFDFANSWYFM